jgi:cytoskeleton protein RodZ
MPSAGELLRNERLQRKRGLSEIASETRISVRYLEAIEEDDIAILPGDFFYRSFIRQYATALRLDESAIKHILEAVEPTPEIDPLPSLTLPQQIAEVEQRSKPLAQVPTRVAVALFLVVVGCCSGLYAIWNRAHESFEVPPAAAEVPNSRPSNASQGIPAAGDSPQIAASVQPEAAPAAAAAPPAQTEALPADPKKINVDLSATEATWVSLSSAGRTVFAGILDVSQTKNFDLSESAKLLTGNAAGLDVRMNGRPIGPIGQRGQVRVVVFSGDHYEILSPHKM